MNTTIGGESASNTYWQDHASVLRREAADGLFHGFASLYSGTFVDMIRLVSRMSDEDRAGVVIEKAGDRQYSPNEIAALARRSDFPA